MISNEKLKEFFLEDKRPNWKKYCEAYGTVYCFDLFSELRRFRREEIGDIKRDISFVDYEYVKRGIFKRGEGYRIFHNQDSLKNPVIFGPIGRQVCYFASTEDAEFFIENLGISDFFINFVHRK